MKKLKGGGGFTMGETLATVLILLMVAGVVATGIPAALNVYRNAVDAANAQVLLSTTINALRDELSTAWDVKKSNDTTITYMEAFVEDYFSKIEDFDADAAEFWDGHMKNIKPFYAQLHREDDVIVTASPELSMREVCRRLGVKHCVGSVIDRASGKVSVTAATTGMLTV